jgi:hypothetical protein
MLARILFILLLAAGVSSAAPLYLESSSLKYLFSISMDRKKDTVSGVFTRSEYGVDPARYRFTGKVVPLSERTNKIYVTFSKRDLQRKGQAFPPTYQGAPWKLVETRQGTRLYVSVVVPVRSSTSPSWKVNELEFEPAAPPRRKR